MGLLPTPPTYQESLCDKLEKDVDTILSTVEKAKDAVKTILDALRTTLSVTPLANAIDYQSAIDDVNSAIANGDFIPTDIDAILIGVATCPYLNKNPLLNNAMATIGTIEGEVVDMAMNAMDALTGIGQFEIGIQFKGLTDLYGKYGIDLAIPQIEDLIICIGGFCGRDISSQYSRLYNLKTLLSLGDNGTIDVVQIMTDGGIDPADIVDIQGTITQIDQVKSDINEAIGAAKNTLKPTF